MNEFMSALDRKITARDTRPQYGLSTFTRVIARRIRRGKPWGRSVIPDAQIVAWAKQYGEARCGA